MRLSTALTRAAAIGALSVLAFAGPAAAQPPGALSAYTAVACDRACLIDDLHRYMDALTHHAPSRAPLAKSVMFTENDVAMPIGEGLWGSIGGASAAGLELADPSTGQAAWFGLVQEHGVNAYYAMRLQVKDGRIAQVETIVHRQTGLPAPFGDVTKYQPACRDNFILELSRYGLTKRDIVANLNFFMNVPIEPSGDFTVVDGISGPGNHVDITAEMDLVAVVSNCPQINNPCNGFNPTPVRVLIWDKPVN